MKILTNLITAILLTVPAFAQNNQTGTVTDIDGNVYKTVKIGYQWWMAENLKVTKYSNGESIAHVADNDQWTGLSTGAYCNYNNDTSHVSTYGRLYNWYAVTDSQNIAPAGWHVPTDEEWKVLEKYLGLDYSEAKDTGLRGTDEGGKLKESGTSHWNTPNTGATNESGFSGLPGGYRRHDYGFYDFIGDRTSFWSTSETSPYSAWSRILSHYYSGIYREYFNKKNGYSVRCVMDPSPSNQSPAAVIQSPSDGSTYTYGTDITFTGSASDPEDGQLPGSSLIWTSDRDEYLGTGTSISIDSFLIGAHTITLTATDSEGAADTTNITVEITSINETGTVTDIDGNVYKTVKIGNQWWMAENLKVTKYSNGEAISHVSDQSQWEGLNTGAYCYYNNDTSYVSTFGSLYNWYAVNDSQHIAPEGWHVPTDEEWKLLEKYLGMNQSEVYGTGWRGTDEGGKLKESGTSHWFGPNEGAANESGFTGLAGGSRYLTNTGYCNIGESAFFWSSSEGNSDNAWYRSLYFHNSNIYRYSYPKKCGYSVRCVRDFSNQSPAAAIQSPSDGSTYTYGTDITFTGSAADPEEGPLSGSSMTWISDMDGFLGTGTSFSVNSLSAGTHTITLTAADSLGASDTASITITITSDNETGTVTDIDGNVYKTVKIGYQWWMAENLKVTRYQNGETIAHVTDQSQWKSLSTGARCNYNNDTSHVSTYGRLYNWHAVSDSRSIAPAGWHIPTDEEWKVLEKYLGVNFSEANDTGWRGTDEGGKLKESGTSHWRIPNTGATNETGFSVLPGGHRNGGDGNSDYNYININAAIWTYSEYDSSSAWKRELGSNNSKIYRYYQYKRYGYSVRCVLNPSSSNQSPIAAIQSPSDSSTYTYGSDISFTGSAADPEDGTLSGSSLTWSSDMDGELGTGILISIDGLSVGTHTIMLAATDSEGASDTTNIAVSITSGNETGMVTDIDGNVYRTIKIGSQWWMAENLKVTKYRNGEAIELVTDLSQWESLNTGAYCNYNNDTSYVSTCGRLYNWHAVNGSQNIAPVGWRVPTDDEWKELEKYLGMSQSEADDEGWRGTDEGGKLKESGTSHWESPNDGATNSSGFSGLPGGARYLNDVNYVYIDYATVYWSSSEYNSSKAWRRFLSHNFPLIARSGDDKRNGFSVRCIRDTSSTNLSPTAVIQSPSDSSTYAYGTDITFSGSADDPEDGPLSGSSLTWSSDKDGQLGTGTSISVNSLSAGAHKITLTAADSRGAAGTTNITITITSIIESGTVTDIDGNEYKTVKIGSRWWMAENLKVTKYCNGEFISHVQDSIQWSGLSTGAWCNYNNDTSYVSTYGSLYNWYAVNDSRSIAPAGWHIPTDEEWKELEQYLGMSQSEADDTGWRGTDEGGKLKESGTSIWFSPNTGADNSSGFSGLPGGCCYSSNGKFYSFSYYAYFWSSSEIDNRYAWHRRLLFNNSNVYRKYDDKRQGFSVRCIRDVTTSTIENDNNKSIPTGYNLAQNFPNPFNPETRIEYSILKPANVRMEIFSLSGQRIKTIVNQKQPAGNYTVKWHGTNESGQKVNSGMYLYRLTAGNFVETKKMVLLK